VQNLDAFEVVGFDDRGGEAETGRDEPHRVEILVGLKATYENAVEAAVGALRLAPHAGRIANRLRNVLRGLGLHLILRHDGNGRRRLDQWRVRLGAGGAAGRHIAIDRTPGRFAAACAGTRAACGLLPAAAAIGPRPIRPRRAAAR
jgi:hypothetical protein